jgi:cytochrome c oxidase cbb3-type subunit I/II
MDPRMVTPGSIMPNYPWLFKNKTKFKILPKKLSVLAALGVPYSEEEIANAEESAYEQAQQITKELVNDGVPAKMVDKEIMALIAYLQRLGTDTGGTLDEVSSTQ